ncbi:hypothetical protein PC116_g18146 [Phytophthora cactorum]|uniref:Uncharacterized protein n=1 Tax=Phytophthora cactorum TaxID=29920 RepID=A0A8T1FL72_9STRA|nr:hypothetical protein PC118_g15507 [Phytophthora cactorum]KAG3061365.1 hypothetical protein PC121_g13031 [Phytophthora cactorum]KAG4233653.1 hypothetical protein PC116_g18146 [Phytophthora cactorum]
MVQRYTKLEPVFNSLGHGTLVEFGIQPLLLRRAESERADALMKRYPQLKSRLSPTAAIVNYVALETGIVKLQWKEPLTAADRVDCADFRRADRGTTDAAPSTQPTSELALVQQAFKKCKTSKRSLYGDVAFIPPTSNECEQFSRWPRWFTRTCGRGWVLRRWRC